MATKRVTIKAYGQTFQLSHGTGNEWKVSAVMPDTSSYSQADHYYPVTVEAEDNILNLINDLIKALTEKYDIIAFDRSDECLHEHIDQIVLLHICIMLDLVYLFEYRVKVIRIIVRYALAEYFRCLYGMSCACCECIKIECVLFLCHNPDSLSKDG